jgi:hypothetical protein
MSEKGTIRTSRRRPITRRRVEIIVNQHQLVPEYFEVTYGEGKVVNCWSLDEINWASVTHLIIANAHPQAICKGFWEDGFEEGPILVWNDRVVVR